MEKRTLSVKFHDDGQVGNSRRRGRGGVPLKEGLRERITERGLWMGASTLIVTLKA